MASLPRASPAALRAAVRDARSSHAICDVTDTLPPQDEASQALPRLYELNEATTKEFLPGTLLLTAAGEVRYVPLEDSIRERAGGWQFRTVSARGRLGAWSGTEYFSKTAAEGAFKAALMGVGTEPHGQGRGASAVRDLDGNPVEISFATGPSDSLSQLMYKTHDDRVFKGAPEVILPRLNLQSWRHYPTTRPVAATLPSRLVLERAMVRWQTLEDPQYPGYRRNILTSVGIPIDIIDGVSAFTLAAFVVGVAAGANHAARLPVQHVRVVAAAVSAAIRAETRHLSTRSSPATGDLSPPHLARIRSGKMVLGVVKNLLDALSPAQTTAMSEQALAAREAASVSEDHYTLSHGLPGGGSDPHHPRRPWLGVRGARGRGGR